MTHKRSWILGLGGLMVLLVGLLGGWVAALASQGMPESRLAAFLPWPAACTPRGCVTTRDWQEQLRLSTAFAEGAKTKIQTREEAFTTVVRRHLVSHAFVVSPVTETDARRYREEVLHLKDGEKVQEIAGVGLDEYDELVVVPFLKQAALMQERKVETPDELYTALAQEHAVLILPFHYRWDRNVGRVVARD